MNEKEIAELRRRFRADKSSISRVRGCYVNEKREIISQFDQSLGILGQTESEQLLSTLRKTLSGTLGKNLLDIPFDTRQVVEGDQHKLLMALRNSALRDEEAVSAFYQRVIQSLDLEGNYLILLVQDDYDVPYRSKDGERQDDASSEVFRYILSQHLPRQADQGGPELLRLRKRLPQHQRRLGGVRAGNWAFSSPPLTSAAPISTMPWTTARTPPRPTPTSWRPCSTPPPPCPPLSRWRPSRRCWRIPSATSAATRWSSLFTASCGR